MQLTTLISKLKDLSATVSPDTVRNWSKRGIVTPPVGRTRAAEWSNRTLQEVAVGWAISQLDLPTGTTLADAVSETLCFIEDLGNRPDDLTKWIVSEPLETPITVEIAGERHTVTKGEYFGGRQKSVYLIAGVCAFQNLSKSIELTQPVHVRYIWNHDRKDLRLKIEVEPSDINRLGIRINPPIETYPDEA